MARILVTGASDGIGEETARQLAKLGHEVIAHGRSEARVRAAVPGVRSWVADFASLEEVRSAVQQLPEGIDVLVNNAGIYTRERQLSRDGHELTFQVNHLAPFLLTNLLLPSMSEGSRIINVSSQVHFSAEMAWDDLELSRGFSGYGAYAQSKLANLLFTRELARRQSKATVNALHPGVIGTKLLRGGFGGMGGSPVEQGAETPVYLATSPDAAGISGKYFVHRRQTEPSAVAQDDEAARKLWAISERLCRL